MTTQDDLAVLVGRTVERAAAAIEDEAPGLSADFRARVADALAGVPNSFNAAILVRSIAKSFYGVDLTWG